MSVKYGKFEIPESIVLEEETATPTFARFIIEPFERGFGHTLGNSMRRVLLSALESPAIISLRIEGVSHEYMAIDGIIEDMTNIILNFKGAKLRKLPTDDSALTHEPRIHTSVLEITQDDLDKNDGQYNVTLGDVIKSGTFDVINPDLHLFTVTKPTKRQIDLRIGIGRGYVPSERHNVRDRSSDEILIDAAYSPVSRCGYFVENKRVGQDTDFDRLVLEIHTDGRVTPKEAISFASQIVRRHFEVFNKITTHSLSFDQPEMEEETDDDEIIEKLCLRIDEIELSVRSTNCLSGANIETIAELVSIPERKMLEFRNFGKKSLNEIKAKLTDMNLHLGMDLARYGITQDNVKDKIRQYQEEVKSKKETTLEA